MMAKKKNTGPTATVVLRALKWTGRIIEGDDFRSTVPTPRKGTLERAWGHYPGERHNGKVTAVNFQRERCIKVRVRLNGYVEAWYTPKELGLE